MALESFKSEAVVLLKLGTYVVNLCEWIWGVALRKIEMKKYMENILETSELYYSPLNCQAELSAGETMS